MWEEEKSKIKKIDLAKKLSLEQRSKIEILKDIESEEKQLLEESEHKIKIEKTCVVKSLELFIKQKFLYDWHFIRKSS